MTTLALEQPKTNGRWTREQHEKFLYGLKLYGKNWKKIQDLIETRSSTQIRSHAQKYFIKMKKNDKFEEQSEIMENESQSKQAQQTILSPNDNVQVEKQNGQFSYYMERIYKNFSIFTQKGKQFNFWNCFIDSQIKQTKSCQLLNYPQQIQIQLRKNRSQCELSNEKEDTTNKIVKTQFSSFENYQKRL